MELSSQTCLPFKILCFARLDWSLTISFTNYLSQLKKYEDPVFMGVGYPLSPLYGKITCDFSFSWQIICSIVNCLVNMTLHYWLSKPSKENLWVIKDYTFHWQYWYWLQHILYINLNQNQAEHCIVVFYYLELSLTLFSTTCRFPFHQLLPRSA